jgi:hypothetical protein
MTKIEQLVKRYEFVRKMWVGSHNQKEEQEWYDKMLLVEKEIKKYKASMEAKNPAVNAMAQYVKFGIKEDKDA